MTTSSDPAAVLRELLAAFGERDLAAMAARWTPSTTGTIHPLATQLAGRDEIVGFFETVLASLDDLRFDVERVVAAGEDLAVGQWRLRATFRGAPVGGVQPTGGQVDVRGVDVQRIRDGVVEHADVYFDALTPLRQLGLAPAPGSAVERVVVAVANARTALDAGARRARQGRT